MEQHDRPQERSGAREWLVAFGPYAAAIASIIVALIAAR